MDFLKFVLIAIAIFIVTSFFVSVFAVIVNAVLIIFLLALGIALIKGLISWIL